MILKRNKTVGVGPAVIIEHGEALRVHTYILTYWGLGKVRESRGQESSQPALHTLLSSTRVEAFQNRSCCCLDAMNTMAPINLQAFSFVVSSYQNAYFHHTIIMGEKEKGNKYIIVKEHICQMRLESFETNLT